MVEYLQKKAKPYATQRQTPEVLNVLKGPLAFIKYLMVRILYTPLGDLPMITLWLTLHSGTSLPDIKWDSLFSMKSNSSTLLYNLT